MSLLNAAAKLSDFEANSCEIGLLSGSKSLSLSVSVSGSLLRFLCLPASSDDESTNGGASESESLFCCFGLRWTVGIAGGGGVFGFAVKVALFALFALFAA